MQRQFPARGVRPAVVAAVSAALLALSGGTGCAHRSSAPRALTPQAFYPNSPTPNVATPAAGSTHVTEDQAGELTRVQPTAGVQFPKPSPVQPPQPIQVTPVNPSATQPAPSTQPVAPRPSGGGGASAVPASSLTPGLSTGRYQLIGTVVAEVNGTPIYANKILTLLNKVLAQKAREYDADQYRAFALQKIQEEIQELVNDEILFAAAQRALSQEDQKLAEQVTLKWRQDQITQAGGSEQVARSRAAADGDDFDEQCRQQFRRNTIEVFRYKKLTPRVQVTVDDMRRYYDKHRDDEYTEHAAVRFRLLEVSADKTGSRGAALEKVRRKYDRAKNGEDFKAICSAENDDVTLASVGGDLGWKEKGSLPPSLEKVESALWDLKPGQLTDIVDAGNAFYVAQLVEVRRGHVRAFDEQAAGDKPSVQDEIKGKLQREQFRELSGEIDARLRRDAIVRTDEQKIALCLDMAMQRYAATRARGSGGEVSQSR